MQAGPRVKPGAGFPVFVWAQHVLEAALEDFAGCAVIISHDRFFLDRLCTHILSFEGEGHVEWFEGNFEAGETDKVRRLGPGSVEPMGVKDKKFAR